MKVYKHTQSTKQGKIIITIRIIIIIIIIIHSWFTCWTQTETKSNSALFPCYRVNNNNNNNNKESKLSFRKNNNNNKSQVIIIINNFRYKIIKYDWEKPLRSQIIIIIIINENKTGAVQTSEVGTSQVSLNIQFWHFFKQVDWHFRSTRIKSRPG
jgi:hypothetical protein